MHQGKHPALGFLRKDLANACGNSMTAGLGHGRRCLCGILQEPLVSEDAVRGGGAAGGWALRLRSATPREAWTGTQVE